MLYLFILTLIMIAAGVYFGYKVHGISRKQYKEDQEKYFKFYNEAKELMAKGNYVDAEKKLEDAINVIDTEEALKDFEVVQAIVTKMKVEEGLKKKQEQDAVSEEKIRSRLTEQLPIAIEMANSYCDYDGDDLRKQTLIKYIQLEDYESAEEELIWLIERFGEQDEVLCEQYEEQLSFVMTLRLAKERGLLGKSKGVESEEINS